MGTFRHSSMRRKSTMYNNIMVDESRRWLISGGKKGKVPLPEPKPQRAVRQERSETAPEERLPENVHTVYIDGMRVDIVRSYHGEPNKPETVSTFAHALCFETYVNSADPYTNNDNALKTFRRELALFGSGQYELILQTATSRIQPVPFFGIDFPLPDVVINADEIEAERNTTVSRTVLGAVAGMGIYNLCQRVFSKERNWSRRAVLAKMGGLGVVAYFGGANALQSLALNVDPHLSKDTLTGAMLDMGIQVKDKQGFSRFIIKLRNLVIAEKLLVVGNVLRSRGVRDPHISGFMGGAHDVGVTEALRLSASDRQELIDALIAEAQQLEAETNKKITHDLCAVLTVPEIIAFPAKGQSALDDLDWKGTLHFMSPQVAKVCTGVIHR